MSNTTEDAVEEGAGPKQTVRNLAAEKDLGPVGPFFPSGMNQVEAAMSGATANMSEEAIAALNDEGEGALVGGERGEIGTGSTVNTGSGSSYDPSGDTIDGVLNYVDQNPGERESVLEAERSGKNRTTLINQLESR